MPFQPGDRLPGERASKLGHLDVLKSPLVRELCKSFEDPHFEKPKTAAQWQPLPQIAEPQSLVFGVDGSMQPVISETKPHKALGFVKTALVTLDQSALATLDKYEPHPFAVRDILEKSQLYHATVFPLRYVTVAGQSLYHAVRRVIFESLKYSLDAQCLETLKWLAYEKWDPVQKPLPLFDCPHCRKTVATLAHGMEEGNCPGCNEHIFLTDWLGFHQVMSEDAAPDSVATDYMGVHETLLLFTGIRFFWEKSHELLKRSLFVKDGPLSIRAQYSKLVNPIRRFLQIARAQGIEVCILGQEKTGTFWEHLQLIGDDAPAGAAFIPNNKYIREEIQHRPAIDKYGIYTNYGAKVFLKLDERHKFVLNIPNASLTEPQDTNLIGGDRIFATLPHILSAKYEDALLPIQMAHSVASLSTYPSAKVLSIFADAMQVQAAAGS